MVRLMRYDSYMKTATIYGLKTVDGPVRYVGQTRQKPSLRLAQHWKRVKTHPQLPISVWLLELKRDDVQLVELETGVAPELMHEREAHWTVELKTLVEDGGLNVRSGYTWHHGRPNMEYAVDAMRAAIDADPETWKARISAGIKQHRAEHPEFAARQSEQMKQRYSDPAARQATADATRRGLDSPEARARLSASGKRRAATPEGAALMSRAGKLGGKKGGVIGGHNRWHVARNIVSPTCQLCAATEPGA